MNDQIIITEIKKLINSSVLEVDQELSIPGSYSTNKEGRVVYLNLASSKILNIGLVITLIEELDALSYLDLGGINLKNLETLTKILNQITQLGIANTNISDITFIKNFKNLKYLDIQNNNIPDINQLNYLNNLTHLNISETKITDVSVLRNLTKLEELHISRNQILELSSVSTLKNIKKLYAHSLNIDDIKFLEPLNTLEGLYIVGNKIKDISTLAHLKNLKDLYIGRNQIANISPLASLTKLENLFLFSNLIHDIEPLKDLHKLELMDLRSNPLKKLPEWITKSPMPIIWAGDERNSERGIILSDNPLEYPPIEIAKKGKAAIQRFFKKINSEGADFIYEVKLTLVGEGSAGKTSLQKRLLNEKAQLPKKDKRTRGIEILDWKFKSQKGKAHIAHIWDFGGQDVYYPVHRFFITENSVFVLLASTRQTHHNFDYWIPTIYQFGGKSPIILGQTCHDGNKISWNDLGIFVSNPNFNIIKTQALPYYELNLINNNEGLRKIKQIIISQITNLPHYGKGVPKSWIPIRNTLIEESKKVACITFDRFIELCKNSNKTSFAALSDITDCCQFLHDIGVVLWYSTNNELRNWVILQPEWAMNAVYKIIDDDEIQKRQGNILSKDFRRLWVDTVYENKHPILKKMLEVFKIAFPKKHKQEDYIIPARLLSMPNSKEWDKSENCLRLEYRYQFMPRGLVNQVSAELSRYIVADTEVWNNAVNFAFEGQRASCQVIEDFFNRKITIRANGPDGRSLIILVMNSLKNIIDDYKGVKPEIYVPCTCKKCIILADPTTFLYDKLLIWSQRKKATVICNESGDSLYIEDLLDNVGLEKPWINTLTANKVEANTRKNIFVSYSKYDEDYLQDFQDHLVTLKDEGFITFDCREIEFGKEWDEEIKKKIDECDILVCLVSVKFLNTEYIRKIEIERAVQQNKTIIPIIIKACDWESSVLGKYQAAQRGKIVSLNNNLRLLNKIKGVSNEEKAAFWTSVIKEFREKILH